MNVSTNIPSPFERILGKALEDLAEPVRRLHSLEGDLTVSGLSDITVDSGILPWLICKLGGLPRSGRDVPVTVRFKPDGRGRELWYRRFADRRYQSEMRATDSVNPPLLVERLGPFSLYFRLTPRETSLDWTLVKWRVLGLPMPRWTLPKVACNESGEGDRFIFDIDAAFPIAGHVIHYRGWLAPQWQSLGQSGATSQATPVSEPVLEKAA